MSDRQKGILNALSTVFPNSLKRYCCRHIYANFKKKFSSELLKNTFWRACRSFDVTRSNSNMEELNSLSPQGHEWLMNVPTVCWAKHMFSKHTKCNHVTNNMTESFNNWIGNYRGMPIVRMYEEIRRKIMRLIHKRNMVAQEWKGDLPPIVRKKVIENRANARSLSVIFGQNNTFEVMEDISKINVLDLQEKKCDCMEWEISGLPCKYVICCIDA
ncbi:unnamed protein product [Cuscuta epithymum]|uniref:SWIM-type domain-containing protein n=1 Tax=Cuscuta epithymum TaxID=186058 RepID=A0AAV0ETA8_9ASTE|nr:unnamed protein product [Cuscuta epithymum]